MWFGKKQEQSKKPEDAVHILLIEDEPFLADLFRVALKDERLHVDIITDGINIQEIVSKTRYSVIFLDITLPQKDGYQILQELRQMPSYSQSPIIMLTNHSELEIMKKAKDLGATDFLIKANMDYTKLKEVVTKFIVNPEEATTAEDPQ